MEVNNRNERPVIDCVLINKNMRRNINGVRFTRGQKINSDHYVVLVKKYSDYNIATQKEGVRIAKIR